MTTLVQTTVREAHIGATGFGVVLLWSLVGIHRFPCRRPFGLEDFSTLS